MNKSSRVCMTYLPSVGIVVLLERIRVQGHSELDCAV